MLKGDTVAFVVGPLDLCDEFEYGFAGALGRSRGSRSRGHDQHSYQS